MALFRGKGAAVHYSFLTAPVIYTLICLGVMAFDFYSVYNKLATLTVLQQSTTAVIAISTSIVLAIDGFAVILSSLSNMKERSASRLAKSMLWATAILIVSLFMAQTFFLPSGGDLGGEVDVFGNVVAAESTGNTDIAVKLFNVLYCLLPLSTSVFVFALGVLRKRYQNAVQIDVRTRMIEKLHALHDALSNAKDNENHMGLINIAFAAITAQLRSRCQAMKDLVLKRFADAVSRYESAELAPEIIDEMQSQRTEAPLLSVQQVNPLPVLQPAEQPEAIAYDSNRTPAAAESAAAPQPAAAEPETAAQIVGIEPTVINPVPTFVSASAAEDFDEFYEEDDG